MSDKPLAGLVTLAAILPLCVVCALGPAAAGAIVATLAGWLGGLGPWAIMTAAAGAAALGYWLRRNHGRRQTRGERSM